jgi:hypothetical protein
MSASEIAAAWRHAEFKAYNQRLPSTLLDAHLSLASKTWDRIGPAVCKYSMVGAERLLATALLAHRSTSVKGDFIETGVAHGGASILMLAVLEDAAAPKRHFACDSFLGLPAGTVEDLSSHNNCSVATRSINGALGCGQPRGLGGDQVMRSFKGLYVHARHVFQAAVEDSGVSSSRMVVVEGWFNETLPPSSLRKIAFLRLDGDLYASTWDALTALYPRVSQGGAIYVDDYGGYGGCRFAVDEYRRRHVITSPMTKIWQNMTPYRGAYTPQLRSGYSFEAVWWIKE